MTVAHAVITGSTTITLRLAEPVTCTGPKLPFLGGRPEITVDRVFLTFVVAEQGWRPTQMAVAGRAVDPEVSTSTLRRTWDRTSEDAPPGWLSDLAREHRPRG